ncbi:MAG: hypothetical protein ACHP91_08890 [Burkholderiales bacterium]|jgi:hypothetical protein
MNRSRRRLLSATLPVLVAALALDASGCATAYPATTSWTSGGIAALEIVDRANGEHLGVYASRGQRFVVGAPGHEYRLRIRNLTGARILAVTSVDGVNVVTGETASPAQSGYVLGPWESLDVDGWRTSLARTAAFYFTDLGDSYAARTGRPNDVGVIGLAVFRERAPVIDYNAPKVSRSDGPAARSEASAPAAQAGAADARRERDAVASEDAAKALGAFKPAPSLGTGYGREETSYAHRVGFERATSAPAETLAVRYDSRANLAAMGVLPQPRVIGRAPDPFPGSFAAPPPN